MSEDYRLTQRVLQTDRAIYCDCRDPLPRLVALGRSRTVVCQRCSRIIPTSHPAWERITDVYFEVTAPPRRPRRRRV